MMGYTKLLVLLVVASTRAEIIADYIDDFTNLVSGGETELYGESGEIGVLDYPNDMVYEYLLYPPSSDKSYTFKLTFTMMQLEQGMSIDGLDEETLQLPVHEDGRKCLDYVNIHQHHYCGTLGTSDEPKIITERVDASKPVKFIRVEFKSDYSKHERGFRAEYIWEED